ncbi:hypothetical protein GCM10029963_49900 [Micromonospora andamanensis]
MSDDYYGWQPVSYPMYAGVTDDYAAERAAGATPYEPTAWDSVNIEQMWEYVRKESDERTTALADMWRRAASLLQTTRDNLKRHADSLDARWQSPAARVFMSRVGATLHSLDEWKEVASNNATGLDQLASKIGTAQREMKTLWEEYRAAQIREGSAGPVTRASSRSTSSTGSPASPATTPGRTRTCRTSTTSAPRTSPSRWRTSTSTSTSRTSPGVGSSRARRTRSSPVPPACPARALRERPRPAHP